MRCCGMGFGQWREDATGQAQDRWRPRTEAFDEHRTATLRRLEEEERAFRVFLSELRMVKDKAEFDQFLAGRRTQSEQPPPQA